MKHSSSPLDLKIFGWIGFAVICLLVLVLPVLIGLFIVWAQPSSSTVSSRIGERGSACGGPERLPCGAGLICAHEIDSDASVGICEPAPEAATSTGLVRQAKNGSFALGQSCAELNQICEPALICSKDGQCATAATSSPRILSVKIDGAQLSDGVYRVIAGTKTGVTIQAVNGKTVVAHFDDAKETAPFKQGKGGVYTGQVVFPSSVHELNLVVQGVDGTWSGLVMKVATVEAVR